MRPSELQLYIRFMGLYYAPRIERPQAVTRVTGKRAVCATFTFPLFKHTPQKRTNTLFFRKTNTISQRSQTIRPIRSTPVFQHAATIIPTTWTVSSIGTLTGAPAAGLSKQIQCVLASTNIASAQPRLAIMSHMMVSSIAPPDPKIMLRIMSQDQLAI